MRLTDTVQFAARDFRQLSGGERQRVVLAGALAQQPSVLLLDEPTTFLDLKHQIETYRLLSELAATGLTVVAVTHDLNLAAAYSGRMLVLHNGHVFAEGAPDGAGIKPWRAFSQWQPPPRGYAGRSSPGRIP